MKRLFFWIGCFFFMNITTNGTIISKALLDHNGTVTLFDGNDMQAAVDAAVDGDIIYLSLGTFKSFTVNKKITIKGVGETSVITGDVVIAIPGFPKLTSPVLETLSVSNSVKITSDIYDLVLRKCKISTIMFEASIDGAIIDRCYVTSNFYLSSYIKGLTVNNTWITFLAAKENATNNTTFVNCNFEKINTLNFSGTIINSILLAHRKSDSYYTSSYVLKSTVLMNSFINIYSSAWQDGFQIDSSSVTQGCYFGKNDKNVNTDYLLSIGYIGNDGTVIGIYGGKTPYTLEPSVPNVTSSYMNLDEDNKLLNVKLTVSPQ